MADIFIAAVYVNVKREIVPMLPKRPGFTGKSLVLPKD
jgi:hypothetical protein